MVFSTFLCRAFTAQHPFTLALTLVTIVILQHMRRQGEATVEHVLAGVALSTEHGFPYLKVIGTVLQGWELTRGGQVAAGLTQMREGLASFRLAMGAEILRPNLLALLADACQCSGQIEDGLGALEEALVTADRHGERFYEAELHRLKGELILQKCREAGAKPVPGELRPDPTASRETTSRAPLQGEAEACFQNALAIARRQGAKLLELRAALSLSRLWQQQGQRTAARQLLEEIYGWFTEGFETADLQEAQTLLEDLA
jgi:predicted ATPase